MDLYDLSSESDGLRNGELMDYFDGDTALWIGNDFDGQMVFESNDLSDVSSNNDAPIIRVDNGVAIEVKSVR